MEDFEKDGLKVGITLLIVMLITAVTFSIIGRHISLKDAKSVESFIDHSKIPNS